MNDVGGMGVELLGDSTQGVTQRGVWRAPARIGDVGRRWAHTARGIEAPHGG